MMKIKIFLLLFLVVGIIPTRSHTTNNTEGLVLASDKVTIVMSEQESGPVKLAVEALQRDFQKILGYKPSIANSPGSTNGAELIVTNGGLNGFEAHRVYADKENNRIVMQGADMRGTIYAIYSFSEQVLGVPPLWYWCDWKTEKKEKIRAASC